MYNPKVTKLLNEHGLSSVEELLYKCIADDPLTYSADRIGEIIMILLHNYMMTEVVAMSSALAVAEERAGYLKQYIEGKMYSDEKTAIDCRYIHVENAEAIIHACQLARRGR